jgi:hypothetical protein
LTTNSLQFDPVCQRSIILRAGGRKHCSLHTYSSYTVCVKKQKGSTMLLDVDPSRFEAQLIRCLSPVGWMDEWMDGLFPFTFRFHWTQCLVLNHSSKRQEGCSCRVLSCSFQNSHPKFSLFVAREDFCVLADSLTSCGF